MKAILKTKGAFELYDSSTREHIGETPKLVTWTMFFETRTGKGQVEVLASDIADDAKAEDFEAFLKDAENEELAVAAFLSSLNPEPEEEKKPARRGRQAKE